MKRSIQNGEGMLAQQVKKMPEKVKGSDLPKGEGETILVVEDEERSRDFLRAVLVMSGYKVILASNGTEGVLSFTAYRNEIKLVLLDMGLPGLSSEEVLSMIRALESDMKIIAVSGLINLEARSAVMEMGASDYLQKPYLSDELLIKLHENLRH